MHPPLNQKAEMQLQDFNNTPVALPFHICTYLNPKAPSWASFQRVAMLDSGRTAGFEARRILEMNSVFRGMSFEGSKLPFAEYSFRRLSKVRSPKILLVSKG